MGVMRCSRNSCENVMCNFHSDHYGYLCYDCLTELKNAIPDTSVEDFMSSSKVGDYGREMMRRSALKFIEQEFKQI